MASTDSWSPAELMRRVEQLAAEGCPKGEFAQRVGIKNMTTFTARLVRASQQTGKPIPAFKRRTKAPGRKRVQAVLVKRRGKGESFGVNIPQAPLERLGAGPGNRLAVTVSRRRVLLTLVQGDEHRPVGTKPPRLIRTSAQRLEGPSKR